MGVPGVSACKKNAPPGALLGSLITFWGVPVVKYRRAGRSLISLLAIIDTPNEGAA